MYAPIRFSYYLIVWLLLMGCTAVESPPPTPFPTQPPLPTLPPTRGQLVTMTPTTPEATPLPSATPDPALLSEVFLHPAGVLSFRYLPTWSITDRSDENEILISAQGIIDEQISTYFVVNLLNAKEEVPTSDFAALADDYLRNLFTEEYEQLTLTYREEGNAFITTAINPLSFPTYQFEIRFTPRSPFVQVLTLVAPEEKWERAAPLLDSMARSVIVNPETGHFVPTPQAAIPRQEEGLIVQNASAYQASTGALFIVGEVLNTSQQAYEDGEVIISLHDESGTELLNQAWPMTHKLLPTNERTPFIAVFASLPDGWATFQARAEALPADFYLKHTTSEFETLNVSHDSSEFASYILSGQLKNIGDDARNIKVISALYNEIGQVLAVASTTLNAPVLPRDEEIPFQISFYTKAEGTIARYEIWVEGTRLR